MPRTTSKTSRRTFLGATGALATFTIVPRHVLGQGQTPPSGKLNMASIGVSGMGGGDLGHMRGSENIIALVDVDEKRSEKARQENPNAKFFKDFREMFATMGDKLDAVTVSTPDHCHAVAAMAAIKLGKHVYCQKPMAHSVWEVREMMKAAKAKNVVTQLGNQGHSSESIRVFCEWIWDGAIGKVHTIHAGCSAFNSGIDRLDKRSEKHEVPKTLDWNLWLGPAQFRPYNPMYCPGSWRGWSPFGTGTIGDWTCHVIDPVFWALDLGSPTSILCSAKDYDPAKQGDAFPRGNRLTYKFAANAKRGPITLEWYDAKEKIPRAKELDLETVEERKKMVDTGAIVMGDKGTIMYGSHGAGGVRIIPTTAQDAYKRPAKTLPRARGHYEDFLNAVKKGTKAGSDFSYGGPLTEIALLGVIATMCIGTELKWDGAAGRFTNSEKANKLLKPQFREGWTL